MTAGVRARHSQPGGSRPRRLFSARHPASGVPAEIAGNRDSRNRRHLDTELSFNARPLEAALRKQGLDAARVAERKVGGLAIREGGGRRELVIGLRKPDDKIRAFAADITAAPSPDATLELRTLFAFDADCPEGIAPQLASVEYVPSMGGFLVLTATVSADNAFHGNTLWLVNNGTPRQARSYATFEPAMKAGGLAVLGVEATGHRTTIKLLITYDNDPHVTRIPSRFQTALLVHDRT